MAKLAWQKGTGRKSCWPQKSLAKMDWQKWYVIGHRISPSEAVESARKANVASAMPFPSVQLVNCSFLVSFTDIIKPIALPPRSLQKMDFTGKIARVTGWGRPVFGK